MILHVAPGVRLDTEDMGNNGDECQAMVLKAAAHMCRSYAEDLTVEAIDKDAGTRPVDKVDARNDRATAARHLRLADQLQKVIDKDWAVFA